jgi:hypothetical protein
MLSKSPKKKHMKRHTLKRTASMRVSICIVQPIWPIIIIVCFLYSRKFGCSYQKGLIVAFNLEKQVAVNSEKESGLLF